MKRSLKPLAGFALAALMAVMAAPASAVQLIDAPDQPALAGRVQLAIESFKILDAYPDKTFQGTRPFTRYELADALWRSLSYLRTRYQVPLDEDPRLGMVYQAYLKPSGDIPERHWAGPALQRVLGYGLLSGTQDLSFHGGAKVSRYMLAFTLHRLFDWLQVTPVKMQTRTVRDVPARHWASEAVKALTEAGVIEPDANGRFEGERTATRYELAESLVRLLQQVDLVAQQRPIVPKVLIPLPADEVVPTLPTGRRAPFYRSQTP